MAKLSIAETNEGEREKSRSQQQCILGTDPSEKTHGNSHMQEIETIINSVLITAAAETVHDMSHGPADAQTAQPPATVTHAGTTEDPGNRTM